MLWKLLRYLLVFAVIVIAMPFVMNSMPIEADTAQNVVVTATPEFTGVGAPTSFGLTEISHYEVQIDWVKGLNADNTMVRGQIGEYPEDRTDGYQAYYGASEVASDYSVNFDIVDTYYYRAWSEDVGVGWSDDFAEDFIGGGNPHGNPDGDSIRWLPLVIPISSIPFLRKLRKRRQGK